MNSITCSGLTQWEEINRIIYKCAELITQKSEEFFLFGLLMDLPINVLLNIYQKDMSMFKKYCELLKCSYEFVGSDFISYFKKALNKMDMYAVLNHFGQKYDAMILQDRCSSSCSRSNESNELFFIFKVCIEMCKYPEIKVAFKKDMNILKESSYDSSAVNLFLMVYEGYIKFSKKEFIAKFQNIVIKQMGVAKYSEMLKLFMECDCILWLK